MRSSSAARLVSAAALLWLLPACEPPTASSNAPCESTTDCLADEICVEGLCRRVCNSDTDCTRSERCFNGACLPLGSGRDAGPDGGEDGGDADDAAVELDGAAADDVTSVVDSATQTDINLGEDTYTAEDAAGGADISAVETDAAGGTDSASSFDAAVACGPEPTCPDCGARTCQAGMWSDCQGGTCGVNSSCSADGECVCDVDQCSGDHCHSGDVYGCDEDSYGCGARGGRISDCTGFDECSGAPPACHNTCTGQMCNSDGACVSGGLLSRCGVNGEACYSCEGSDPCTNYWCLDGGGCSETAKGDGESCGSGMTCQSGDCCVSNRYDDCGGTCDCGPCGLMSRGYIDCDGSCALILGGVCNTICNLC